MINELLPIFFNVITPVFVVVLIGYFVGKPLQLDARTLSRTAYYVFIPAFVFSIMSTAQIDAALIGQMIIFMVIATTLVGGIAYGIAKLLRRSAMVTAAYVMIATFPNVGNFGLPIISFKLGEIALADATMYFLIMMTLGFIFNVGVANLYKGNNLTALVEVLKTPALVALVPALLVNWGNVPVPLMADRLTTLLGDAMVPTMLFTLGVQLRNIPKITISRDVVLASLIRLVAGGAIAIGVGQFFQLSELTLNTGIIQASMPVAVLTSIIALEYDVEPNFVTTSVLFSTLLSVVTLTVLLAIL